MSETVKMNLGDLIIGAKTKVVVDLMESWKISIMRYMKDNGYATTEALDEMEEKNKDFMNFMGFIMELVDTTEEAAKDSAKELSDRDFILKNIDDIEIDIPAENVKFIDPSAELKGFADFLESAMASGKLEKMLQGLVDEIRSDVDSTKH